MNVSVPAEFVPFVDELVAKGTYTTAEDVVCAALEQMRERRAKFEALKASLNEAKEEIARGDGMPFDLDEILAEARQGHVQRRGA